MTSCGKFFLYCQLGYGGVGYVIQEIKLENQKISSYLPMCGCTWPKHYLGLSTLFSLKHDDRNDLHDYHTQRFTLSDHFTLIFIAGSVFLHFFQPHLLLFFYFSNHTHTPQKNRLIVVTTYREEFSCTFPACCSKTKTFILRNKIKYF